VLQLALLFAVNILLVLLALHVQYQKAGLFSHKHSRQVQAMLKGAVEYAGYLGTHPGLLSQVATQHCMHRRVPA
jgi:hypothetical protein